MIGRGLSSRENELVYRMNIMFYCKYCQQEKAKVMNLPCNDCKIRLLKKHAAIKKGEVLWTQA